MPRTYQHNRTHRLALVAAAFAAGALLGVSLTWPVTTVQGTVKGRQADPADSGSAGAAAAATAAGSEAAIAAGSEAAKPDRHPSGDAANASSLLPRETQPAEGLQGPGPAAAAAAAGLQRTDPQLGERSQRWAPMVLNRCTPDMPRHYAPCLVGNAKDPK